MSGPNPTPEEILLHGIEKIAHQERSGDHSYNIMTGIDANEFAGRVLLAYWKAKAS